MAFRPRRSKSLDVNYAPSDGASDSDESLDYAPNDGASDSDESLDGTYVVASCPEKKRNNKKPAAKKRTSTKPAAKKPAKKRNNKKTAAKKKQAPLPMATKKRAVNAPLVDRSNGLTASRQRPTTKAAPFLLTGEGPSQITVSWNNPSVEWTEHASESIKDVFKQDMLIGSIKGATVVAADLAVDVKNCQKWIKFDGNGRTTSSNSGNSLGSIFDYREEFPSLEPMFDVIDRFQVKSAKVSPPKSWIQGNNSVTSPGVTNTHIKHKDRMAGVEKFVKETFGAETKRVRIAVSATPPAGVHEGRIKETRYAYQGREVLRCFATEEFSFTMMGPRANGKEPFYGSDPGNAGSDDEEGEITLLNDGYTENEDDDDDDEEEESITSPHMTHGVYNNAGALSIMLEVTIEDGKVYEFYKAFSTCYDTYSPNHAPGSVQFEFPCAAISYREPKREEKRLLAAKQFEEGPLRLIQEFINERGHGAISSDKQCSTDGPIDPRLLFLAHKLRVRHSAHQGRFLNPHIKEMLDRVGFVFNINLWIAERTVGIMEEYGQDGADINSVPYDQVVRGYQLGRMVAAWKSTGSVPGWMQRPDLKRRLDAMGFDMSLNSNEAKFAAKCRQLKAWKLRNNGSNPGCGGKNDTRDKEEKMLYKFRWTTSTGHYHADKMKNPKLKALFDEAEAVGQEH